MAKSSAALTQDQVDNPRYREENLTKANEWRMTAFQAVAADATIICGAVERAGRLIDVRVTIGAATAAGESMTIDVQKGNAGAAFATVLSGLISIPAATAARGTINGAGNILGSASAAPDVAAGDTIEVILDYTAGGGPTPLTNVAITLVFA